MNRISLQITHLTHPPREGTIPWDSLWQILKPSISFLPKRRGTGAIVLASPFIRGEIKQPMRSVEWLQGFSIPPFFQYPEASWDCVEATAEVEMADPWVIIRETGCQVPEHEIVKWDPDFPKVLAFRLAAMHPGMGGMYPQGAHGLLHWVEGDDPTEAQFVHVIRVQLRPLIYLPTPTEVARLVRRAWPERRF